MSKRRKGVRGKNLQWRVPPKMRSSSHSHQHAHGTSGVAHSHEHGHSDSPGSKHVNTLAGIYLHGYGDFHGDPDKHVDVRTHADTSAHFYDDSDSDGIAYSHGYPKRG